MHGEDVEIAEVPYAAPKYVAGLTDKEISGAYGKKALASRNLRRKTQQAARDRRKAETGYSRGHSRAKKEELETEQHAGKDYYKKRAARWKMGELGPRDAPKKKQEKSAPKGSTAEETEMSPMIRATIDKIHSMREDKLSYKERQKLPSGDFALPGKGDGPEGKQGGSYPIPDESHARNALARVSQHGSEAEKRKVKSAVARKFPEIKIGEAKDRGVGTDAYTNYVAGLTPGQEADSGIHKSDAKEDSAEVKRTDELRKRQSTRIDDEYVPTLEEYSTHLESLEGEALEVELETLDQNELLEILGTGLVKKAAGAIKKRFSTQGRLKAAKAKGARIQAKTDLATQKTGNIAAKAKMKDARAKLKAAKQGARDAKNKPANVKMVPGKGIVSAEYDHETLVGQAMSELSKKTLGSYVQKSADSSTDAGMALQRTADKNQTRGDVDKHVGKLMKRRKGREQALKRLTK